MYHHSESLSLIFLKSFSQQAVEHVQSHLSRKQVMPTLFQVREMHVTRLAVGLGDVTSECACTRGDCEAVSSPGPAGLSATGLFIEMGICSDQRATPPGEGPELSSSITF